MQHWEMSHLSFCSSRNFTGNHMEHESCGHFFIFPTHARLSRGTPFSFCGNIARRALKLSKKMKKEKKKRQILLKFTLFWNIKPICIRTKGLLPYIKAVEGRRFVGYQWGRNLIAPSLKQKPVKPAASSHRLTEMTSFLLAPLHQQSNHSRLSGNGRYSSHFDLERGSSHYSPIALMDDSWVR